MTHSQQNLLGIVTSCSPKICAAVHKSLLALQSIPARRLACCPTYHAQRFVFCVQHAVAVHMQASVAYYLMSDNRRRMPSSAYLRAEMTEIIDVTSSRHSGDPSTATLSGPVALQTEPLLSCCISATQLDMSRLFATAVTEISIVCLGLDNLVVSQCVCKPM